MYLQPPENIVRSSLVFVFFSLFFISGMKDEGIVETVDFANQLTVNPIVATIKNYSPAAIVFLFFGLFRIIRNVHIINIIAIPMLYFVCALPFIAAIRSIFEDSALAYRMLFSCVLLSGVAAIINIARVNASGDAIQRAFNSGFTAYALSFVSFNLFNLATGNGYLGNVPRLYGTTSHPNFIAVQTVLCLMALVHAALSSSGWRCLFWVASAFAAAYILYLTGSRNGILMMGAGIAVLAAPLLSVRNLIALGVMVTVGYVVLTGLDLGADTLAGFDRGNETDNRTEGWLSMIEDIQANPIIGMGYFDGYTINSFMRGWKTFGILYAIGSTVIIVATIANMWSTWTRSRMYSALLSQSIFVSLLVGSMFEGYLSDAFTLPVIAFQLIVIIAKATHPKYE